MYILGVLYILVYYYCVLPIVHCPIPPRCVPHSMLNFCYSFPPVAQWEGEGLGKDIGPKAAAKILLKYARACVSKVRLQRARIGVQWRVLAELLLTDGAPALRKYSTSLDIFICIGFVRRPSWPCPSGCTLVAYHNQALGQV